MTSERLNRVTSKIETAIERLSLIDREAMAQSAFPLAEASSETATEKHRQEIDDRDRKIAKLRADIEHVSELKDQEIDRLRSELDARAASLGNVADREEAVDRDTHAALQQRYDRLERSARATRDRLDTLIKRMESASG